MNQTNSLAIIPKRKRRKERGFTLLELGIATVVLMFGIVGVVQLVPVSQTSTMNSRVDTTAMVFAQRELDQMVAQPLTATTFNDSDGRAISLGSNTVGNTVVGGPAVMSATVATLNFTAAAVANYNYTFQDPNDPLGPSYQMRWAVISNLNGTTVVSKRFIVGCRRVGAALNPAVVDTWVQK
jgi:Tfp pilus assembly protein PilV